MPTVSGVWAMLTDAIDENNFPGGVSIGDYERVPASDSNTSRQEAVRIKTPPLMEEMGSDGRSSTIVTPPGDVHSEVCKAQSRLTTPRSTPTTRAFRPGNRSWPKIPRYLRPPAGSRAMSEPPKRRESRVEIPPFRPRQAVVPRREAEGTVGIRGGVRVYHWTGDGESMEGGWI